MLKKIGIAIEGKTFNYNGLSVQIDGDGLATLITDVGEILTFTTGNLSSVLNDSISFKHMGEKEKVINRTGSRGKKFKYTLREKRRYFINDVPVITTSCGRVVDVDQFGLPYHPDALDEKQYYDLDGEIVTLNSDLKQKAILRDDLMMPIFLGSKGEIRLSFKVDRYAIANDEGKAYLFDQSAGLINCARVMQYEKVARASIKKHFFTKQCPEASYNYDDLMARAYEEITKALTKFSSDKTINSVSQKSERKTMSDEDRLKFKQENLEISLIKGERQWITNPTYRAMWRLARDNSEKVKEGKTVSLNATLSRKAFQHIERKGQEEVDTDIFSMMSNISSDSFVDDTQFALMTMDDEIDLDDLVGASDDVIGINWSQAHTDYDELMDIIEESEGLEPEIQNAIVKDALIKLSPERLDEVKVLMRSGSASRDERKVKAATEAAKNDNSVEEVEVSDEEPEIEE